MNELIIVLLVLNLIVTFAVWHKCGQIATPVTSGTIVVTGDNPNRGPQVFPRSDYDEYKIEQERQGKPVEPEIATE